MASDFDLAHLEFTGHAVRQMFARGISKEEVRAVVDRHEIIGAYLDDTPYPSWLLFGIVEGRALHVVLAYNEKAQTGYVVTAYEPDPEIWQDDFKTRRPR